MNENLTENYETVSRKLGMISKQEIMMWQTQKLFGKNKKNDKENLQCYILLYLQLKFSNDFQIEKNFKKHYNKYYQRIVQILSETPQKELDVNLTLNIFLLNIIITIKQNDLKIEEKQLFLILKEKFLELDLEKKSFLGQKLVKNFKFKNLLNLFVEQMQNSQNLQNAQRALILFCKFSEPYIEMLKYDFIFTFEPVIESFDCDQLVRGFKIMNVIQIGFFSLRKSTKFISSLQFCQKKDLRLF